MKNLVLSCLDSRLENNRSIYARFLLTPFKSGEALTVGTSLRRALLSNVAGIAITALDIQGITHEFSTMVGVRESVLEVSLNFQRIVLASKTTLKTAQLGYLQVKGPAVVYANDLKLPHGIECVDPTQYIATLAQDGVLVVKFLIGDGHQNCNIKNNITNLTNKQIKKAKKLAEDLSKNKQDINLAGGNKYLSKICLQNILPLDPLFTPVNRVNFTLQVDDLSNGVSRAYSSSAQIQERLFLEIWTNGSIHPRQALHTAAMSLITTFSIFRDLIHFDSPFRFLFSESNFDSNFDFQNLFSEKQRQINKRTSILYKRQIDKISFLSTDLSELTLSLKTYMFLKKKGVHQLNDILQFSTTTLLQLVEGNKSMFFDIKRCIAILGLKLQDVSQQLS